MLLPFGILTTTFLISYQRSKAESLGLVAKGGLMERAERLILLGVGLVATPVLIPVLWIMLGLTAMTAGGRFWRVWQVAARPAPAPSSTLRLRQHSQRLRRGLSRAIASLMVAGQARVALFKTVGAVMEALPERLDLGLAMAIAQGVGHRHRSARANLTANLRHVLAAPGEPVDDAVLDEFVERGFRSYGQYWAEGAKLPGIKPARVFERFVIAEGLEHLYAAKERGKGLIIALPHIGSWEWGGSYLNSLGLGMTAVAEELEPPGAVSVVQREA